jgi:hypothetical protein
MEFCLPALFQRLKFRHQGTKFTKLFQTALNRSYSRKYNVSAFPVFFIIFSFTLDTLYLTSFQILQKL